MFGAKAHMAALEKGLETELIMVPFDSDDRYEPKHPEVLRINPKKQVPVLIHGQVELFDSTQIFEYFEDLQPSPALWPEDFRLKAKARLLEHLADEVYFPHVVQLMGLQDAIDSPAALEALEAASRFYEEMEQFLQDQDYLVGSFSYADIAFYMAQVFGERKGALMTKSTPGLWRWRDRMTKRSAIKQGIEPLIQHLKSSSRPVPDFLQH